MNWKGLGVNPSEAEVLAARAAERVRWTVGMVLRGIASPIERQLVVGLLVAAEDSPGCPSTIHVDTGFLTVVADEGDWRTLLIRNQARVDQYAADFALTISEQTPRGTCSTTIYIECDGHDFHEKTKAQAAHDKKRDRHFTAKGLTFLRFTGSEIYRSHTGCASEALKVLLSRHEAVSAPLWAAYAKEMGR